MTYKIVFESGVTETIEAETLNPNDVLDKVEILDADGEEKKGYYLNFEHISAIIPQE